VPRRDSDLTAWVNVIYGCNERCTYCVVPFTRGQEQSRRVEDIRREMLALGEAGAAAANCSCCFGAYTGAVQQTNQPAPLPVHAVTAAAAVTGAAAEAAHQGKLWLPCPTRDSPRWPAACRSTCLPPAAQAIRRSHCWGRTSTPMAATCLAWRRTAAAAAHTHSPTCCVPYMTCRALSASVLRRLTPATSLVCGAEGSCA
jgi:hypothetical protein